MRLRARGSYTRLLRLVRIVRKVELFQDVWKLLHGLMDSMRTIVMISSATACCRAADDGAGGGRRGDGGGGGQREEPRHATCPHRQAAPGVRPTQCGHECGSPIPDSPSWDLESVKTEAGPPHDGGIKQGEIMVFFKIFPYLLALWPWLELAMRIRDPTPKSTFLGVAECIKLA